MAKINELLKQEVIPLSEDLPAVDDPDAVLKNALTVMGKSNSDWNHHFDAVTNVRKVIVNNPEQVNSSPQKLKNVLVAILDQVDNLRSLVSRNAISCVADSFAKLGKSMDSELDYVIPRILKKYGDTSKFYEEECDKALKQCVAHCSSSKVLTVLIGSATHKHVMVRGKVAFFIATCVTGNMGSRVLKFKEMQKLLQAIAQLLQDGSSETRIRAKQTIFAIYNYMTEDEFEKLINRNVTPSEVRTLKETIIKLKKEQSIVKGNRPDIPNDGTDSHTASPNTKSPLASTDPSPSPSPGPNAAPVTPMGISRIKPPSAQRVHGVASPKDKDNSTDHSTGSGGTGTLRGTSSKPPAPAEYVFKSPAKAESALNDMEENITVAVRVRPMNKDERGREIWKVDNDTVICVDEVSNSNRALSFAFDNAFGQSFKSTQDIYEKVGQGIVYSVMEGYNGTVFAYGQTNSGKTYTMMGNDDNPGFIPLAISSIFDFIKNTPQREFLLRVSYLEIYNEVINDLLRLEGSNLNIREDKKRGVYIEGLKEEIVVSPEHVMHVINSGEAHRHVASTDYNLISSRSHTIFRIIIESSLAEADKKSRVSCLTLIDLAGSEKVVSDSIVRKREGAYINKSLLTLGTIISKLSERKKGEKIGHLPYRDSKLTRILEPSLSGNSKIAIIATVTPASPNFEETTNTLKFAARAKKVTKEKAVVNEDEKALLSKYKAEIEELRRKLELAQEAEMKLKDLQEQSQNQQVEELKKELLEQEELRASLEEKIKQLTKLILVSATVEGNRTRTFTNHMGISDPKRIRSATMKGVPLANVKGSEDETGGSEDIDQSGKESLEKRLHTLEKINEAMNIKIEALQQQAEWRDKQIHKMKVELKEKDEKLKDVVNMKVSESDKLEQLKVMLIKQYAEQIERMQDDIKEREMEIAVLKSDTKLLVEKLLRLEKQQS